MSAGPDLSSLSHAQKDALIAALMAQVASLTARVAELEAKLGLPPKTPDNSSVPPSKGQKPSKSSAPKAKAKAARRGASSASSQPDHDARSLGPPLPRLWDGCVRRRAESMREL